MPTYSPLLPGFLVDPPAWDLTVHPDLNHNGILSRSFDDSVECVIELTPAFTRLLLVLVAARAIDERKGVTRKVGHRTCAHIGRMHARMPDGNAIEADTVGTNKRRLMAMVKKALSRLAAQENIPVGDEVEIIGHGGYGQGYFTQVPLELHGIELDDLVRLAQGSHAARAAHATSATTPVVVPTATPSAASPVASRGH